MDHHGSFVEHPDDPHVRLRDDLLSGALRLPRIAADDQLRIDVPDRAGVRVADLAKPLDTAALLALGHQLGTPMAETHPGLLHRVEHDVILNITSAFGHTHDVDDQPFSTTALTLHSESSAKPHGNQPRYIVLVCTDPGSADATADTVVVSMADVAKRLEPEILETLRLTRYRRAARRDTIARRADSGEWVFSFRDPNGMLEWTSEAGAATQADVAHAIRQLLAAMYTPGLAMAVAWRRGTIAVIDNAKVFHGKTAGGRAKPSRARHLRRIRILSPTGGA